MATKNELINRVASPMRLIEENYDLGKEEMDKKRKKMIESQHARSPFLIGSIDEINTKISKLDRKLHTYAELVIDSQASDHLEYFKPPSAKQRELYQKKEKEAKEINQFAGIYAIKSSFIPGASERVKNISKISMNPSRQNVLVDSGKPKFVELHQYPGYDPAELTPMPHGVSATQILSKVSNAQPKLKYKPQYLPEFERLFYSQMSQAILQDTFWWYFLEKYQRTSHYQIKLFNRIAHNYIKLLTYANHSKYKETFLKEYPSLLSQGVYTCFCESFPDSYRQFGEDFKEDLVNLVYEWVAGIRPQPRTWLKWNLSGLEPPHIKMREEIMNQAKSADKKTSSLINFDLVEAGTTYSQTTGSQSTLNQIGSLSSSYGSSKSKGGRRRSLVNRRGSLAPGSSKKPNSTLADIQAVSDAQELEEATALQPEESMKAKSTSSTRSNKKKSRHDLKRDEAVDPLTPIREFEEGEETKLMSPNGKTSRTSNEYVKSYISLIRSQKKPKTESHPIGKGPDFVRQAFNINGQSPLVAHFLRMRRLETDAGVNFRVQRTQMENLPPLNTPTYREVIRDSYKHVQQIEKEYDSFAKKEQKSKAAFIKRLKEEQQEYKKRETALLNKPHEVKRLSDLLMLEMTKDQDSITAGANAAIEAALLSAL